MDDLKIGFKKWLQENFSKSTAYGSFSLVQKIFYNHLWQDFSTIYSFLWEKDAPNNSHTLYDIHSRKVLPHLFMQPDRIEYVHQIHTNKEQNDRTALPDTSDSDIVVVHYRDMNNSLFFVENICHIWFVSY